MSKPLSAPVGQLRTPGFTNAGPFLDYLLTTHHIAFGLGNRTDD